MNENKVKSILDFEKFKNEKKQISVMTCYDYSMAKIIADSNIDAILVGDSLGMVFAGQTSTVPVELDEMIYHAKSVRKGAPESFIIVDMPFLSYHASEESAVLNAGKILKHSDANALKVEGGAEFADVIKKIVRASIPVMGHLGLTPQSVNMIGGFKVQGRNDAAAAKMLDDAKRVEDAGAFSLVLEMVPEELARKISESISIPVIGIGAGRYCDGQVLVVNDILGMTKDYNKKFLKKYANLYDIIFNALNEYNNDVKEGIFPSEENAFK